MGHCQGVLIPIRNQPDSLVREEAEALSPLMEETQEAGIVEHRNQKACWGVKSPSDAPWLFFWVFFSVPNTALSTISQALLDSYSINNPLSSLIEFWPLSLSIPNTQNTEAYLSLSFSKTCFLFPLSPVSVVIPWLSLSLSMHNSGCLSLEVLLCARNLWMKPAMMQLLLVRISFWKL